MRLSLHPTPMHDHTASALENATTGILAIEANGTVLTEGVPTRRQRTPTGPVDFGLSARRVVGVELVAAALGAHVVLNDHGLGIRAPTLVDWFRVQVAQRADRVRWCARPPQFNAFSRSRTAVPLCGCAALGAGPSGRLRVGGW